MRMSRIVEVLDLKASIDDVEDVEVTGGYVSDLLSDVLANAKAGNVWITNQKHQNCVAVASLLGLAGVVIAGGIRPDENTLEKAGDEKLPLFTTQMPAFDVVGKLYDLGIRG